MADIIISQSLIKALDLELGKCPGKAKAMYFDGMESTASAAMQTGNYFETLIYGSTDSGEVVNMAPLASGAKSADQQRIEKHARQVRTKITKEFHLDWAEPRKHISVNIKAGNGTNNYSLRARTDLVTSIRDITRVDLADDDFIVPKAILDFKITGSILNSFGPYAWGQPETMDHRQADFYVLVYKLKYKEVVPFYYLVMDTSPKALWKFVRKNVSNVNFREIRESIRRTIASIEFYQEDGWPLIPSMDECRGCPIRDSCPSYTIGGHIQIID